jgi:putative flippase GtrA
VSGTPNPIARQAAVFVAVGLAATATQAAVAFVAHETFGADPYVANFVGYAFAVVVSYVGHARITFLRPVRHRGQMLRFALVSLAGLALTQAITFVVLRAFGLPFRAALVAVAVLVPAFTFVASRAWTFAERRRG